MPEHEVFIYPGGTARAVHSDSVVELLAETGPCTAARASSVELADDGYWYADLSRIGGPRLGPFPVFRREWAIAAEIAWLNDNYLPHLQGNAHADQPE